MTDKWDKERETIPVINLLFGNKEYSDEFMKREGYNRLHRRIQDDIVDSVQWHKDVFGRQSYCWVGEYRFWVWDFHDWRIYVSNIKGTSVEVDPSFDAEQAMFVMRYYWDKMGL